MGGMWGGFKSFVKRIDPVDKFGAGLQFLFELSSTMPSFAEALDSPESTVSLKRDADTGIHYTVFLF